MDRFFTAVQNFTEKRLTNRKARIESQKRAKRTVKSELLSWLDAIVFGVIVVFLLSQYVFELFLIPSPSMESTLGVKDRVFVSKQTYGIELFPYGPKVFNSRSPDRDDIITFYNKNYEHKSAVRAVLSRLIFRFTLGLVNTEVDEDGNPGEWLLVKRTAGLRGDTVTFVNGDAYIKPAGLSEYEAESVFREKNNYSTAPHRFIPEEFYDGYKAYVRYYTMKNTLKIPEKDLPRNLAERINAWIDEDYTSYYDLYAFNLEEQQTIREFDPSDRTARSDWTKYKLGVYVPEGSILPLGDNRDNSNDGRYFGPVSFSDLNGRVVTFVFPLNKLFKSV